MLSNYISLTKSIWAKNSKCNRREIYSQHSAEREGITQQNWNHQWPSAKADAGVATGSPVEMRASRARLPNTNHVQKPGSAPSSSDWQSRNSSKMKPRLIHYLTASFSAVDRLWLSKENNQKVSFMPSVTRLQQSKTTSRRTLFSGSKAVISSSELC